MNVKAILDRIMSHAQASGKFDRVNGHEPKNAPGNGLSVAVWIETIAPVPSQSGLGSTTGRVAFNIRLYSSMLQEPQDGIDVDMADAVDLLMTAYSGDFEFGGNVKNVDLLGSAGTPMQVQAGYLNQDGKLYRIMTIVLPVIVNDLWEQAP